MRVALGLLRIGGLLGASVVIQRLLQTVLAPRRATHARRRTDVASDADTVRTSSASALARGHGFPASHRRASVIRRWLRHSQALPAAPGLSRAIEREHRGAFLSGAYTNGSGTRAYQLYIPTSYHGQALPLVVMLHGCKQNPDDFAAGTRMNGFADQAACFVVYPEQAYTANRSRCWNWFEAAHQRRGKGEPSLIAGITRQVIKGYPIDTRRVYVAGLSAGGAMAAVMGATYPDLYAAVGIHSGLPYGVAHDLSSALELMKQGSVPFGRGLDDGVASAKRVPHIVPTIVFHGDSDTTVHPRNGDYLHAHGLDARATVERGWVEGGHGYTRAVYRDSRKRPILEQWQVHGAGHAWSGGSFRGSYTDPDGPDATREMIRFFFSHPRRRGRSLLRWAA